MEDGLLAAGRVLGLVTRGRRTGRPRPVAVGFIEGPDGEIVIAANTPSTAWALNLLADPRCEVRIGDRRFTAVAEPLDREGHARAVSDLILRYGTPSEGLGRGPSFRLRPVGQAS
jgi:deazaflavin-dependent oxidoreductase (nitroreductase family)